MSAGPKLANALLGTRVGAVIVFREGTSVEEAQRALINVPCVDAENVQVEEFNPQVGYPVWYIP
jgi:hypothetical protein